MDTPLWVTILIGLFAGFGVLSGERSRQIAKQSLKISKANREDIEQRKAVRLTAQADWSCSYTGRRNPGSFGAHIQLYNSGRQVRITAASGWNEERQLKSRSSAILTGGHLDIEPDHSEKITFSAKALLGCESENETERIPTDAILCLEIVGENELLFLPIEGFEEMRRAAHEWKMKETQNRIEHYPLEQVAALPDYGF